MSIHVILGKPGSGKSLFATKKIIRELRESKRNIVTNVPLNIDKLNEWVQKKFPAEELQVPQRVRMLTDEELKRFWEIRGPGHDEEWTEGTPPVDDYVPNYDGKDIYQIERERDDARALFNRRLALWLADRDAGFMAFGDRAGKQGVCYLLDECHIAFNARDWATIGRGALHYLSQHRKLGDIVYPITQSPGNLDKQFRSVAEDFTVLRNEYTAKFGIFRGRGRFTWKTYLHEPSTGNKAEPFVQGSFVFNGEENCYDTARGIGVHGNKADIGRRAKGIPIMWVIPMGLALALSCVAVPWYFGKKAGDFVSGGAVKVAGVSSSEKDLAKIMGKGRAGPVPEQPRAVVESASDRPVNVRELLSDRKPETQVRDTVFPTGYAVRGGNIIISMSDGTWRSDAENVPGEVPVVDRVTRSSVWLDGKKMYFKGSPTVTPPKKEPPPPKKEESPQVAVVEQPAPVSDYRPIMPDFNSSVPRGTSPSKRTVKKMGEN